MTLLLVSNVPSDGEEWAPFWETHFPGRQVQVWPEINDLEAIEFAFAWKPPAGLLATFPNLKFVQSLGAGVDHIVEDPAYPRHVPLARLIDPGLTEGMTEFVVHQVLDWHRSMPAYRAWQAERKWDRVEGQPLARERVVGILGLGVLGQASAHGLRALGFPVLGWSRSPKVIENVECHSGPDGLDQMLERTEILVNLLPLTDETRGILSKALIDRLSRGAVIINAARGGHMVPADLLAALDAGHLRGVTSDVFEPEPLPADDPLWAHPGVIVTPHIAAVTLARTAARLVAENLARFEAGETPVGLVDLERGY